jgi:hypothetical protein
MANTSRKKTAKKAVKRLESEYHGIAANLAAFSLELVRQLTEVFQQEGMSLAVPRGQSCRSGGKRSQDSSEGERL